jgi:hypothetical protein
VESSESEVWKVFNPYLEVLIVIGLDESILNLSQSNENGISRSDGNVTITGDSNRASKLSKID